MSEFTRTVAVITAMGAIIAAAVGGYFARGSGRVVVQLPDQAEQALRPDEAGKRIESLATRLAKSELELASSKEKIDELSSELAKYRGRVGNSPLQPGAGAGGGSTQNVSEVRGFLFRLEACTAQSERIACALIVTSKISEKTLQISSATRIVDEQALELSTVDVAIGNKSAYRSARNSLALDVPMKILVQFPPTAASVIALLELYCHDMSQKFSVTFRDVPIGR